MGAGIGLGRRMLLRSRVTQWSVVVALVWPTLTIAQQSQTVSDTTTGVFDLQLELVATLSDPDGRAGLSTPLVVERTYDGQFLVVPGNRQGEVLLFNQSGEYVRVVGRTGQGPGEFSAVIAIQPGLGDSTVVMDAGNRRLAVLDPDFRVARSARVPAIGAWFGVVNNGEVLILTGIARGGASSLDRLLLLGPSLEPIRSFMPTPVAGPDNPVSELRRRMSVTRSGIAVVAHQDRYVIELWSVSGRHVQTLVRDPAWFRSDPSARPQLSPDEPAPAQATPRIDAEGRIWTVSHLADDRWREALSTVRSLIGRDELGVTEGARDRYQDSVIEVIDPDQGSLLASLRVDPHLTFISNSGFAASYRQDDLGNPFIDVWRLLLVVP